MSDSTMSRRRFLKLGAVAVGTVAAGGGAVKAATYAPPVERPSSEMGDGDMKALVVYATGTGCTAGIAEQIGKTLAEEGWSVDVRPAEDAGEPGGYNAVVVGSGIRAGGWHAPAKTWVETNAEALKALPVAFYSCGLTITQPDKEDEVRAYTDPLIESSGVRPVDVGLFAGWFEPKQFSFIERTVMKLMKAPQGDHRDFDAVAEWTRSIGPRLSA